MSGPTVEQRTALEAYVRLPRIRFPDPGGSSRILSPGFARRNPAAAEVLPLRLLCY
jgi:hypothetical protein